MTYREVTVLEVLTAGGHEIVVEAEIPPGVYFLRSNANGDVATRKFVLAL
jgi:hypothetical protein